jgi:hypothetical protein
MQDVQPIPIRVPVWAWLLVALAVMALLVMTMSNSSTLAREGNVLHEFFHDARHFIGVPCH